MNIVPGEEGCTTISIKISMITIQGNKSTKPRGMDIFELPFSRIRLLKKASREERWSLWRERSSREGGSGAEGKCFITLCTNPMIAVGFEAARGRDGMLQRTHVVRGCTWPS